MKKHCRSTYISVLQVLKLTHDCGLLNSTGCRRAKNGWDELALSCPYQTRVWITLWALAVAAVLFGSSKGEDITFSGDRAALLSLGEALPRAGSPCSGGSLWSPPSPVAIGELSFCVWQLSQIISKQLPGKLASQRLLTTTELLPSFQDTPGQPLLASLCYCSLGSCPGCTPASPWSGFG